MTFSRLAARAALISGLMAGGATGAPPVSDDARVNSSASLPAANDADEGTAEETSDSASEAPSDAARKPRKEAGGAPRDGAAGKPANPVTIDVPGGGRVVVDLSDPRAAEQLLRGLRRFHVEPLPDGPASKFCIGIMVHPLTPEARALLPVEGDTGVVVQETLDDSPANLAGLEKNDVIVRVGDKPIADPAALVAAVDEAGEAPITIHFLRKGEKKSVELKAKLRKEMFSDEAASRKMLEGLARENQELHDAIAGLHKDPANRLHPGMMITRMGPGFVTGPGAGAPSVQQIEELTGTIRELTAEVARLRETVDKLQKQAESADRK